MDLLKDYQDLDLGVKVCGVHASTITKKENRMEDIPSIQFGTQFLYSDVKTIFEIGAQSARVIAGIDGNKPPKFAMNEGCAGGTGSFFEDQMHRLHLRLKTIVL